MSQVCRACRSSTLLSWCRGQFPKVQTVCRTKEIPLLLDKVIDVPVVQGVQLPTWWSRRAENCGFPQLQFSDTLVTCTMLCKQNISRYSNSRTNGYVKVYNDKYTFNTFETIVDNDKSDTTHTDMRNMQN